MQVNDIQSALNGQGASEGAVRARLRIGLCAIVGEAWPTRRGGRGTALDDLAAYGP